MCVSVCVMCKFICVSVCVCVCYVCVCRDGVQHSRTSLILKFEIFLIMSSGAISHLELHKGGVSDESNAAGRRVRGVPAVCEDRVRDTSKFKVLALRMRQTEPHEEREPLIARVYVRHAPTNIHQDKKVLLRKTARGMPPAA